METSPCGLTLYTQSKLEVVGPVTNRSVCPKRQVVRRDAGLKRGEDKDLPVAGDLKNCAAAVADVQILSAIKSDPSCNAHPLRIGGHRPVWRDPVNGAVMSGGNVHLSGSVEGDCCGIHQISEEGFCTVVGVDLVNRDRHFLSPRTGEGRVDVAFGIKGGIGDGVKILCYRNRHLDLMRVAGVAVSRDDDRAGGSAGGHASD